jgi:hypothetical protein
MTQKLHKEPTIERKNMCAYSIAALQHCRQAAPGADSSKVIRETQTGSHLVLAA